MGKIASKYGDMIIITDDNPRDEDRNKIIQDIYNGILPEKRDVSISVPERKKAIRQAVKNSCSSSIIAILGKGHEKYYLVKNKKLYFDDFEEISKY